jgi:hypothetical protein
LQAEGQTALSPQFLRKPEAIWPEVKKAAPLPAANVRTPAHGLGNRQVAAASESRMRLRDLPKTPGFQMTRAHIEVLEHHFHYFQGSRRLSCR